MLVRAFLEAQPRSTVATENIRRNKGRRETATFRNATVEHGHPTPGVGRCARTLEALRIRGTNHAMGKTSRYPRPILPPSASAQSVRWSIRQLTRRVVKRANRTTSASRLTLDLPIRNLYKHTISMANDEPFQPEHGMQSTPEAQLRLTSNLQPNRMFCKCWYLANKVLADVDRPTHDPRPRFRLTRHTADHHAAVHSRGSAHNTRLAMRHVSSKHIPTTARGKDSQDKSCLLP